MRAGVVDPDGVGGVAAHAEVAADLQDVAVAGLLHRGAQIRAAAVDLVAGDVAERHPGGDRAVKHLHRQIALGHHHPGPLRRHPGLGAAGRVQRERLRQIQLDVDQRLPARGHIPRVHRHLAVLHLPGHPGVLPRHPHGVAALLDVAGLVEHQHPVRRAQRLDHIAAQVLAHPALVPHRPVQQPLHPVRRALTRGLRHRPPVAGLSCDRRQQPLHVPQRPLPWLRPEEPRPDQLPQLIQLRRPLLHQPQIRLGQLIQPVERTGRHHIRHDPATTTTTNRSLGQDQLNVRL